MSHVDAVPADTSRDADDLLFERFAAMTPLERARVTEDLNAAATAMAIAGIRHAHGDLPEAELRWHLAARRYGPTLADEVYGARQ